MKVAASCWFNLSGSFNRILDAKVANSSFKNQTCRRLMHQGPGGLQSMRRIDQEESYGCNKQFCSGGAAVILTCKDCGKTTQALFTHPTLQLAIIW